MEQNDAGYECRICDDVRGTEAAIDAHLDDVHDIHHQQRRYLMEKVTPEIAVDGELQQSQSELNQESTIES